MSMSTFEVYDIEKSDAKYLVETYHYSGKCPGIKYTYGLFESGTLVGAVVYAVPASMTLCTGVCGPEYRGFVVELARLVIVTQKRNAASALIGGSLRIIPDHVVVSYADANAHIGHVGYVYQATNWLYTGRSSAEPIFVLEADHPNGLKAGTVVSYTRRHIDVKARDLGFDWGHNASNGPGLVRRKTVGKHRYVCFTGTKRFKQEARQRLRYEVLPYPKGETRRHYGTVLKTGKDESRNGEQNGVVIPGPIRHAIPPPPSPLE